MKSKYLRDIDCETSYDDDKRKDKFEEEIKEYGLASYETWNVDISFAEYLYIIFNMYDEKNIVDTHAETFTIKGREWDLQECIDYVISETKKYLVAVKKDIRSAKLSDLFYEVLKEIMPAMWW